MLGSFKIRLLMVMVIATLAGLSLQSENVTRQYVEPAVRFVLKDYGANLQFENMIARLLHSDSEKDVPTSSSTILQVPCEFTAIEKKYGWYWNENTGKQEFSPGIYLQVKKDSLVRPVLPGKVETVLADGDEKAVLIHHEDGLYSYYGGLREVLVSRLEEVNSDQPLGRTGERVYFELKNDDGPLNPNPLFE